MGEYTPVECFFAGKDSVKRGMPKVTAQIIIGTPGTVIDVRLFHFYYPHCRATGSSNETNHVQMVTRARVLDLKDIKAFVLDEADNMLDSGSMGEQSISLKKYPPSL